MTDDIDPTYDEDFPAPHYDPPELNDLGSHYIGVDGPKVEHHKDYASMTRGANYLFDEEIDYDPRIDNIDDKWSKNV